MIFSSPLTEKTALESDWANAYNNYFSDTMWQSTAILLQSDIVEYTTLQ